MLIKRTYSIAPSERDLPGVIRSLIQNKTFPECGFVLNVRDLKIKDVSISSLTGHYVCRIEAIVDYFLPEAKMEVEAVVEMNRDRAHIGIVEGKLKTIFYSNQVIAPGSRVKLILKEVKYQMGTYRAAADLL